MENISIPDELCVEFGDTKQCMEGEYLLAAVMLECCFYFIAFVFGVKVIDWFRRILRGEKHSRQKGRPRLLQEEQR